MEDDVCTFLLNQRLLLLLAGCASPRRAALFAPGSRAAIDRQAPGWSVRKAERGRAAVQ